MSRSARIGQRPLPDTLHDVVSVHAGFHAPVAQRKQHHIRATIFPAGVGITPPMAQ